MCVFVGTSDRLVSGLSLFLCGLWQLRTHQGWRTDPVTPNILSASGLRFPSSSSFSKNRLNPENEWFLFLFPAAEEVIRLHWWTRASLPLSPTNTNTHRHAYIAWDCTAKNILFIYFYCIQVKSWAEKCRQDPRGIKTRRLLKPSSLQLLTLKNWTNNNNT